MRPGIFQLMILGLFVLIPGIVTCLVLGICLLKRSKRLTGKANGGAIALIVIGGVGLLLCLALPILTLINENSSAPVVHNHLRNENELEKVVCRTNLKIIQEQCDVYKMRKHRIAKSMSDLIAADILNEDSRYDPWGSEYRIDYRNRTFEITSAGPDRRFGTADDIMLR